jgi:hypothetical protein
VCFDGFLAEVQLRGDLRVCLAVDDEPGELQLALREGRDAVVATPRRAAVIDGVAESAELAFGLGTIPSGAEGIEVHRSALELGGGSFAVPGNGQAPTCDGSGPCRVVGMAHALESRDRS